MRLNIKMKSTIFIVFFSVLNLFNSSLSYAASAGYQQCSNGSTCSLGEYLYDDSYTPITDATCTITSRYPNGTLFLNAQSMTSASENDGWYSYTFSPSNMTQGIYRSQITCVTGGDTLRLDKTFTIGNSSLTSSEVTNAVWDATVSAHTIDGSFGSNLQNQVASVAGIWSYSGRTLTSYGTLIADIWNYSSRSLTSFGTLVTDIWDNATRTLTGGSFATKSDIDAATNAATLSIKGSSNKDLSQLDSGLTTAQASLDSIEGKVTTLNTTVNTIESDTSAILSKWGSYSMSDVIDYVDSLESNLGVTSDTCAETTIFGGIRCIRDKWGSQTADTLYTAANNAATTTASLRSDLNYNGKSSNAYDDIQAIKTYATTINSSMLTSTQISDAIWDATISAHTTNGSFGKNLQNPVSSLSEIWNYPSRTLTSFGTLVADIWNYGSRSLTTFGSLIADVWSNTTRTLSGATLSDGGQLGTKSDIDAATVSATTSIKGSNNKSLSDVSEEVAGVQTTTNTISTKVDTVSSKVDTLTNKVDTMSTNVTTLLSKWGTSSVADILSAINSIDGGGGGDLSLLGTSSDTCSDDTVYGQIKCIQDKWGVKTANDLYTSAHNAETTIDSLRAELNYNGKSTTAYDDLQTLKTNISATQALIGSASDASSISTLFGKIKKVQETTENLDTSGANLTTLLDKWGSYSAADIYDKVKNISSDVSDSNSINGVSDILNLSKTNASDMQSLKNSVLELLALTQANKTLIENGTTKPIIQTWLEEGSIIFNTLITNPSSTTQVVPIKFYLPKETAKNDIIKMSPGLKVGYDTTEDAYFVVGQVTLQPNATQIFSVEVTDVWKISQQQIDSLKFQAKELYAPLKGTSYFAQGATLYADIIASLDSAITIQAEAQTPDARIKAYRDALVHTNKAKGEIDDLKTLATSVSSNGNLLGFIGGVQIFSVWGLVLILVAGFVFLALYMRLITAHSLRSTRVTSKDSSVKNVNNLIETLSRYISRKMLLKTFIGIFALIALILVVKAISPFVINTFKPQIKTTAGVSKEEVTTSPQENKKYIEVIPEQSNNLVNVRKTPGVQNIKIGELVKGKNYVELARQTDNKNQEWVEVMLSSSLQGWVLADYVQEVSTGDNNTNKLDSININDPKDVLGDKTRKNQVEIFVGDTGVNLREGPSTLTKIITTLNSNTQGIKVNGSVGWVEVEIDSSRSASKKIKGWLKEDFVK